MDTSSRRPALRWRPRGQEPQRQGGWRLGTLVKGLSVAAAVNEKGPPAGTKSCRCEQARAEVQGQCAPGEAALRCRQPAPPGPRARCWQGGLSFCQERLRTLVFNEMSRLQNVVNLFKYFTNGTLATSHLSGQPGDARCDLCPKNLSWCVRGPLSGVHREVELSREVSGWTARRAVGPRLQPRQPELAALCP